MFGKKKVRPLPEVSLPDLDGEVAAHWSPPQPASPPAPPPSPPPPAEAPPAPEPALEMEAGVAPVFFREMYKEQRRGSHRWGRRVAILLFVGLGLAGLIVLGLHLAGVRVVPPDEVLGERVFFGEKSAEEVYYARGATEADAERLGRFLLRAGFFDGHTPGTVQVVRHGDGYAVSLVVRWGVWDNPEFVGLVRELIPQLSQEVFGGAPVEVRLCHSVLDNQGGKLSLRVMKTLRP